MSRCVTVLDLGPTAKIFSYQFWPKSFLKHSIHWICNWLPQHTVIHTSTYGNLYKCQFLDMFFFFCKRNLKWMRSILITEPLLVIIAGYTGSIQQYHIHLYSLHSSGAVNDDTFSLVP